MPFTRRSLAATTLASIIVATAAVTVGAGAAPVAAAGDPRQPVSSHSRLAAAGAAAEAATSYWTPARMARARPMAREVGRRKPDVTGSTVMRRRGRTIEAVSVAAQQDGRVVKAAQVQPAATYPFPFGRRRVEAQLGKLGPYRAVGRIFFRRGGVDYSCSGASVASRPRHVVFTAGHCLNSGRGTPGVEAPGLWSTKVVFVPGRKSGKIKSPFGVFGAIELWVPEGWQTSGLFAYDLGAFHVGKNAQGKTLKQAVGALGFAYNRPRVQHWDIFGYPAVTPFSGDDLTTCASAFAVEEVMEEGPNTTGVGCDMTDGSSGGPWILQLRRGSYLNSVVSYSPPGQTAAAYGPYFDGAANRLRCASATGDQNVTDC